MLFLKFLFLYNCQSETLSWLIFFPKLHGLISLFKLLINDYKGHLSDNSTQDPLIFPGVLSMSTTSLKIYKSYNMFI